MITFVAFTLGFASLFLAYRLQGQHQQTRVLRELFQTTYVDRDRLYTLVGELQREVLQSDHDATCLAIDRDYWKAVNGITNRELTLRLEFEDELLKHWQQLAIRYENLESEVLANDPRASELLYGICHIRDMACID